MTESRLRELVRALRTWSFVLPRHRWYRRGYVIVCLVILFGTTLLWTVMGAHLQIGNADQLSDPYLFQNSATFHGAHFPGAHTFLLKWPIFWLVAIHGTTSTGLFLATLGVVLMTVASLAFILYRIERRPIIFGTLCLALSLVLLLIPPQPYAGGILPVNMAMLTTRNIEYIAYILALTLFIRANRLRSWRFAAASVVLALLIASDKFFLSLSVGGALLLLVLYATVRNWVYVTMAVKWLLGSIVAFILSAILLSTLQSSGVTYIDNQTTASPYQLTQSSKGVALGISYAALGLLTNMGANPAFNATELKQVPKTTRTQLLSLAGPAFVMTLILAPIFIYSLWGVFGPSLRIKNGRPGKTDKATQLSIMLIATTVIAIGVFVLSNHYYAVDARYLTISLFAFFIGGTTWIRTRTWRPDVLFLVAALLCLGIASSIYSSVRTTRTDQATYQTIDSRNAIIAEVLQQHKVDTLVGDYWRVLPVKLATKGQLTVTPLSDCTQPRTILTSSTWQPSLFNHSFAYLLSEDSSLTDYPHCTLAQVTAKYGRPNSSFLIAGNLEHPQEQLFFFTHTHPQTNPKVAAQPSSTTTLPIPLSELPDTACSSHTIMNVVAHQDDDILFMNPDLLHDIKAGNCVRTVYLTAGDDGLSKFYWLNRQLGAEAAYSSMLGSTVGWVQHIVKLANNEYVTVASPHDNMKVSLIFFNVPDGNIKGDGFPSSHSESLQKLYDGKLSSLHTVDGQSSYTSNQLKIALSSLMDAYLPGEIRTQANVASATYPDHSDHTVTDMYTQTAALMYDFNKFDGNVQIPVKRYIGYPVHGYPANVSEVDLIEKEAAFMAYAAYDGNVCNSVAQCLNTPTYGAYLTRQYQQK